MSSLLEIICMTEAAGELEEPAQKVFGPSYT